MASYYEAPPINQLSTPASGVANALQEIVSRRAFEKRQAMLDELNRRQTEAQMDVARQNAESMAEYRKAQAEDRAERARLAQQAADEKRLGTFAPGQISDPGSIEWLKEKFPQSVRTTAPQLGPEEQGPVQETTEFLGTPAYQQQQKENSALLALESNPQFQQASPLGKMIMMKSVMSDPKDVGNIAPLLKQEQPARFAIRDPRTGKISYQEFPAGTQFETPSHPPQGPQPQFMGMMDPTTNLPIFQSGGEPYITKDGKRIAPGGYEARPSAASGADKIYTIPPADSAAISKARADFERSKAGLMSSLGITSPGPGDATLKANLNQRMMAAASKMTKDENVKTALRMAITSADGESQDAFTVASKMAAAGVITPEQQDDFANILTAVRGQ